MGRQDEPADTAKAPEPGDRCSASDHAAPLALNHDARSIEQASRIFRALGDPARLRLAVLLAEASACVSELAEAEKESLTTISQRLRVLRADNIVHRRRAGKHILYSLADRHIAELIANCLDHAGERDSSRNDPNHFPRKGTSTMATTTHAIHENHTHQHEEGCGHTAIRHDDHVDYLHDGHLHAVHEDHIDEHTLAVNATNPADCTEGHPCEGHGSDHTHGAHCGHETVPHGDHVDYLVDGHLHHAHNGHCDNHGSVDVVR